MMDEMHGHASRGAIGRYYELRARLRHLYRTPDPDPAAVAQVLDALDQTHRHFKESAWQTPSPTPAH